MRNRLQRRPGAQRGAGALLAVVLLYAAMAFIVVFANRSLVFEQKTSANQYRSTMALEAAEAGLEWATTMLNKSGGIGATCLDDGAGQPFREKYMDYDGANKRWVLKTNPPPPSALFPTIVAACVTSQSGSTNWNCSCPAANNAPSPAVPAVGGYKPGFAIAFETNPATRAVNLVSYACTSPVNAGSINNPTCPGDASATVRVTLANIAALTTSPGAPLTARGYVAIGNAALGVRNGDPDSAGVTINAGMGIDGTAIRITSTPGTPPSTTLVGNDDSLRNSTEDQMFQTYFGVPKATWRDSVADARLTCPCTETDVQNALAGRKRKLWLQGNLVMTSNVNLGTWSDPFLMVVDGTIEMRGDIGVWGVLYSTGMTWNNTGGGNALIAGAAISEGNYTGNGAPDYYYDPRVMERLREIPGRFTRVPGSWRDF